MRIERFVYLVPDIYMQFSFIVFGHACLRRHQAADEYFCFIPLVRCLLGIQAMCVVESVATAAFNPVFLCDAVL